MKRSQLSKMEYDLERAIDSLRENLDALTSIGHKVEIAEADLAQIDDDRERRTAETSHSAVARQIARECNADFAKQSRVLDRLKAEFLLAQLDVAEARQAVDEVVDAYQQTRQKTALDDAWSAVLKTPEGRQLAQAWKPRLQAIDEEVRGSPWYRKYYWRECDEEDSYLIYLEREKRVSALLRGMFDTAAEQVPQSDEGAEIMQRVPNCHPSEISERESRYASIRKNLRAQAEAQLKALDADKM